MTPEQIKERDYPMMVGTLTRDGSNFTVQFTKDKELIEAVREMRQLQREFFRDTRDKEVLSRAKVAEKRVDGLLEQMDSNQERLL